MELGNWDLRGTVVATMVLVSLACSSGGKSGTSPSSDAASSTGGSGGSGGEATDDPTPGGSSGSAGEAQASGDGGSTTGGTGGTGGAGGSGAEGGVSQNSGSGGDSGTGGSSGSGGDGCGETPLDCIGGDFKTDANGCLYCDFSSGSCYNAGDCDDGEICYFSGCEDFGFGGQCIIVPETCDDTLNPLCGCDGNVYDNDCLARQAGQGKGSVDACSVPSGYIPCGEDFCDIAREYCLYLDNGNGATLSCREFPEVCGSEPECACLADELLLRNCEETCAFTDEGGMNVTCEF